MSSFWRVFRLILSRIIGVFFASSTLLASDARPPSRALALSHTRTHAHTNSVVAQAEVLVREKKKVALKFVPRSFPFFPLRRVPFNNQRHNKSAERRREEERATAGTTASPLPRCPFHSATGVESARRFSEKRCRVLALLQNEKKSFFFTLATFLSILPLAARSLRRIGHTYSLDSTHGV